MIPGLRVLREYVTPDEGDALLAAIDASPWLDALQRRVQHYGYRYDYKARRVSAESYLGPLPTWLDALTDRLTRDGVFAQRPDQAIVNEYTPSQGISAHVDCVPCFGPVIASLSLGSGATMDFSRAGAERMSLYLVPRGLVVMADEARYAWRHAIPGRKNDAVEGVTVPRGRRVSITFRTVIV